MFKKVLFYTGWFLLIVAFLAAGAETSGRIGAGDSRGAMLSAHDLWRSVSPGTLSAFQNSIGRGIPFLWSPVMTSLLLLPGWLLFGGPGGLLAWFCRPVRAGSKNEEGDPMGHMDLFEQLSKAAKEEGYDDEHDDMAPNVGQPDWAGDEELKHLGKGKHEDMGMDSADFANQLSKRAEAEGYTKKDGDSRPKPTPKKKR